MSEHRCNIKTPRRRTDWKTEISRIRPHGETLHLTAYSCSDCNTETKSAGPKQNGRHSKPPKPCENRATFLLGCDQNRQKTPKPRARNHNLCTLRCTDRKEKDGSRGRLPKSDGRGKSWGSSGGLLLLSSAMRELAAGGNEEGRLRGGDSTTTDGDGRKRTCGRGPWVNVDGRNVRADRAGRVLGWGPTFGGNIGISLYRASKYFR